MILVILREVICAIPVSTLVLSPGDLRILAINDAFTHLMGYSPEECVGHPGRDFGFWVNPSQQIAVVEQLKAHGSITGLEARLSRKSREHFTAVVNGTWVSVGGREYMLWFAIDITAERAARTESEWREQLLQALISTVDASPITVSDRHGFIRAVLGERWQRFTETRRTEMLGRHLTDFTDEKDGVKLLSALNDVFQTGTSRSVQWNPKPGPGRTVRGRLVPIHGQDGKIREVLGVSRDVTRQIQTAAALEANENIRQFLVDHVFDAMPEGMTVLNAQREVIWMNATCEELFGIRLDENLGRVYEEVVRQAILPFLEDPEAFVSQMSKTHAKGTGGTSHICHLLDSAPGGERWLECKSYSVTSEGLSGIRIERFADISPRIKTQERLRRLKSRIRVAQRHVGEGATPRSPGRASDALQEASQIVKELQELLLSPSSTDQ